MKRQNHVVGVFTGVRSLVVVAVVFVASCSDQPTGQTVRAVEDGGWITPPVVEGVEWSPRGLTVRGRAMPSGRVAFSGAGDTTYAVGADREGRFDLTIVPPSDPVLVRVESRHGQEATPAPYRLLIAGESDGPVVLVAPGTASRRLDLSGPLDAIDSDGLAIAASGRAAPRSEVEVSVGGGTPLRARADESGRWTLVLKGVGADPVRLSVAGREYIYPGTPAVDGDQILQPAGDGWRSTWTVSPGALQTSWYPRTR